MGSIDKLLSLVVRLRQVGERLHCSICHGEGWIQVFDNTVYGDDVTWEPCRCNPKAT